MTPVSRWDAETWVLVALSVKAVVVMVYSATRRGKRAAERKAEFETQPPEVRRLQQALAGRRWDRARQNRITTESRLRGPK